MANRAATPPFALGDEFTVTVESLADRGMGLARVAGFVVFVRLAVPGDRVKVVVVRPHRSYAEAKITAVLEAGPARTKPPCRYYGICGGCSLQHVVYPAQLTAKKLAVQSALRHLGSAEHTAIRDPLPSPAHYRYRNKMEFSFGANRWLAPEEIATGKPLDKSFALGLHIPRRFNKVVNLDECLLPPESASALLRGMHDLARANRWEPWNARKNTGYLRNLVIRHAASTADLMVNLVTRHYDAARMTSVAHHLRAEHAAVTTFVNTINETPGPPPLGAPCHIEFGPGTLREQIGPYQFEIGPGSFFQTNTPQAIVLCELVREFGAFAPEDVVWDLYCGIGMFALFIADSVRHVVGIELVPEAIEAAQRNARANSISNVTFVAGDLRKVVATLPAPLHRPPDVVIVDPPRAGMHPKVVQKLVALRPRRIIYVSCNPRSQARDLVPLLDRYRLAIAQPVDLFPQTFHIENVALLVAR